MSQEYTSTQYAEDVNFIVERLVNGSTDPQDEVNARVMLKNVIDYEPIHGDIYEVLPKDETIPSFDDVRGV